MSETIIANRYRLLEVIGQGGMGVVYRTLDRLNNDVVALKQVNVPSHKLQFSSVLHKSQLNGDETTSFRLALAQEFRTLSSLRHPNIISVLDYGFDAERGNQPYFTMTLLPEARSLLMVGRDQPLKTQIELIIQLLHALAYLHRRGVIHRDLKPDNVLVDEGQVRVVDFGLALSRGDTQHESVAGTLFYMAPEIFGEQPATEQSDLYAVGVMAYELLLGVHPFAGGDVQQVLSRILTDTPNLSPLSQLPIASPELLVSIIGRLLAKAPEARYPDAYSVIADLHAAFGEDMPEESTAVRESFLQAAQFVGREAELQQLTEALHCLTQGEKRGSAWLVAGESGVGKSRLLDELRPRALVAGVIVLRGQAVIDTSTAYQMWYEPLRRLALLTTLNDMEAGVLKDIVPEIGQLVERPIPDAPALEGKAYQQRLAATVIDVIRRATQPLLLLLEDLQWAGPSLHLLKALSAETDLPLLIVGNYRNDEIPDLPDLLPDMQVIRLMRLDMLEIAALSQSMLGDRGRDADVIDLLNRETEGNVLFLIEVVRALAEEAGTLENIGMVTLPQQVFAGGIQTVLTRRLARVPDAGRHLLQQAALIGRSLDLRVIARLVEPGFDLDGWLTTCVNVAVLDWADGRWRFAHDQLRDTALRTIQPEERRALHRKIAEAIEDTYPNDESRAPVLVEHWSQAGDVARERHYTLLAGEQMFRTSAFQQALKFYERALSLTPVDDEIGRMLIYTRIGEVARYMDAYDDATYHLEAALKLARKLDDAAEQANALHQLAAIMLLQGRLSESRELLTESLALARASESRATLARSLFGLGDILWRVNEQTQAAAYLEESIQIANEINDSMTLLQSLNRMGTVQMALWRFEAATKFFTDGMQLSKQVGNRERECTAYNNLGAVAWYARDYAHAQDYYQQGLKLAREMGNRSLSIHVMCNLAFVFIVQGKGETALPLLREALQKAQMLEAVLYELLSLMGYAALEGLNGRFERGLHWFGAIMHHPGFQKTLYDDINIFIQRFWGDWLPGDREAALAKGASLSIGAIMDEVL